MSVLCQAMNLSSSHMFQQLIHVKLLETDAKGESLFNVVRRFISEKNISMTNIVASATDDEPSLIGCHHGFMSYLKVSLPNVFTMRCVTYRQHPVANNLVLMTHSTQPSLPWIKSHFYFYCAHAISISSHLANLLHIAWYNCYTNIKYLKHFSEI